MPAKGIAKAGIKKSCMGLVAFMALSLGVNVGAAAETPNFPTKPQAGTVTLTFDDGPSPVFTPQILAILSKYHIHAVFFMMAGLAKHYPEIVKQIIDSGNIVASHTISHPMLTKLSETQLLKEIKGSRDIIAAITGKPPVCIRPPYLATNSRVIDVMHANGMVEIMGYITGDYLSPGVQKLTDHVLANVHPGMILIFHDGEKGRAQTVAALPGIIEGIQKKGIGFSTICE